MHNNLPDEYSIRTVELTDIDQLLLLENEWPEGARASKETLLSRIRFFQPGYFIAEDETGIIASIIACPYQYKPGSLNNFSNWEHVVTTCYQNDPASTDLNALYIVSGTSKPTRHGGKVFDGGVQHVVDLAKRLNKQYVIGGCLLPGYSRYLSKHGTISAYDYVFKQVQGRYVDPLIDKYRKMNFCVPDAEHVIPNYFRDEASLNYSALVVRDVR